jgi:hypothetical protein
VFDHAGLLAFHNPDSKATLADRIAQLPDAELEKFLAHTQWMRRVWRNFDRATDFQRGVFETLALAYTRRGLMEARISISIGNWASDESPMGKHLQRRVEREGADSSGPRTFSDRIAWHATFRHPAGHA